jgi:outer membrane protein assembly factor BamB
MGFLTKKIIYTFIVIILVCGCGKSLIEISTKTDDEAYPMFGRTASREFFVPVTVSDSIVIKWESEAYGSFRNSSVTVYDDFVFTSDLGGRIFVFNIEDGKKVGMLKSKESIFSAPLLFKSLVIYAVVEEKTNISQLIYYDHKNGKEVHLEEIEGRIISEMIALDNGVIFLTDFGMLFRYDLNGKIVWQSETNDRTRCSPSVYNKIIILGNDNGEIITLDVDTGNEVNRVQIGGIFTGSSSVENDLAYISNYNGILYCVDLNSLEVVWEFDTGAKITMTPALDDRTVVIGNLKGSLFSLEKSSGNLNWKNNYGGVFNATPLLTNNRIIIPDLFRSFHIIDKHSGSINKSILLDGRAKLTPVLFDSTLFIGYDRGILRAYEFVY